MTPNDFAKKTGRQCHSVSGDFSNFGYILVQKMYPLSLGTTSSKVSAIPVLSYAAVRVAKC